MDIPKLSMSMAQSNVQQAASIAVLKKSMDMVKEQGKVISQMIENSAVEAPSTIDLKV